MGEHPGEQQGRGDVQRAGNKPWLAPMACRATTLLLGKKKKNNPQPQLLKIYTGICALAVQSSKICTEALGNGWMVLGILFLTKCS